MSIINLSVMPEDVKNYTTSKEVKNRDDDNITIDIRRAIKYIKMYTNNNFAEYEQIPTDVINAIIILSDFYARKEVYKSEYTSETLDEYSYTKDGNILTISDLDIDVLLDEYVIYKSNVKLSIRKC